MLVGAQTIAHAMLVGQGGSGSKLTSPLPAFIGAVVPVVTLRVGKMPSRKAGLLTFNIGYTGVG